MAEPDALEFQEISFCRGGDLRVELDAVELDAALIVAIMLRTSCTKVVLITGVICIAGLAAKSPAFFFVGVVAPGKPSKGLDLASVETSTGLELVVEADRTDSKYRAYKYRSSTSSGQLVLAFEIAGNQSLIGGNCPEIAPLLKHNSTSILI